MTDDLVFFSEADDDLQNLMVADKGTLIRRIYCYTLLSDGIVLHPAYIWQSEITNDVILNTISTLFPASLFRVLHGDGDSVEAYIKERMGKVSPTRLRKRLFEYQQYKRWGSDLLSQAKKLDRFFQTSTPIQLGENRDKKFRALLGADVSPNVFPHSLYSQLSKFIRDHNLKNIDLSSVSIELQDHIESAKFVSVESFSNYVSDKIGLPDLSRSLSFRKRMLDIYYHANVGEEVHIPALKIVGDRFIDPFDPDVFWSVFSRVFGKRTAEVLTSSVDEGIVRIVLELRDSLAWQEFRSIYFTVLQDIDTTLWENMDLLQKQIEDKSGYSDMKVVRRVWREKRAAVCGAIFGALGLCSIPATIWVLPLSIASVVISVRSLKNSVRRYVDDYHSHELTRIKETVRANILAAFRKKRIRF